MKKLIIAILCSSVLTGLAVLAWTTFSQAAKPAAAGDSFLSILACSFNEYEDGYDFKMGFKIYFDTGSGYFFAPVDLPNGSIIKKVILICWDNGSSDIDLTLRRVLQNGAEEVIATFSSSGTGTGYRIFTKKLTTRKYVNTRKHSHFLMLYLPGTTGAGYKFSQAKIVYAPPSP